VDQLRRNVEHDTIGDRAEPLPTEDSLARPLLSELCVFPVISAYTRTSVLTPRYVPFAAFTLLGTSVFGHTFECSKRAYEARKVDV
jgi:hypothetical protein